jgi:vanillate/3-O-methylgallate O-demethylase
MPMPLPAIYHGEAMKPYREWLTTHFLETIGSLGGSFVSDNIADYYVDPIEVGYRPLIDFNREFIGRDALAQKAKNPQRSKVTLVWNNDDVFEAMRSSLSADGGRAKYMGLPNPMYATFQHDAITKSGKTIGASQWLAWSSNVGSIISLSLVNAEHCAPGTEVKVLWGEPDSRRRTVEKHEVREIRAKVAPAPYFEKVIKTGRQ